MNKKIEYKRKFRWLVFVLMTLFLFTGCGDLEPDMQDTRTVILNMDFHGKSSLRSSSGVSASELSQYNTHLILAVSPWEYLTSNYINYYYSSKAQGLMNTVSGNVTLGIPLNTDLKIFAFLIRDYYSLYDLISGTREVGYYGESQSFSINPQTNNYPVNITLQGTGNNTGNGNTNTTTELEGVWKTACFANSDNTFTIETATFVGNVVTIKDEKHSDTSCTTDDSFTEESHPFSLGDAVNFSGGKTGHEFTVTISSTIKRTPQSSSTVSYYNSVGKCSASDWELNTEKECIHDDASDTYYCIYQLDGNNLYAKCSDGSSYPSTSDLDTDNASNTFVKQ